MNRTFKLLTPLVIFMLAFAFAPVYTVCAAASSDQKFIEEVHKAVRDSSRSQDLQTELPEKKEGPEYNKEGPESNKEEPDYNNGRGFRISSDIANIILWCAVAVVLVVVVMYLVDNFGNRSKSRRLIYDESEEAAPQATAARMDKAQVEADDLAKLGSFAEAMHVLLLQSVSELRRRLDVSIAASLTSREILYRIGLPPEGREVFADIIHRVEISYFGPHQPGQGDYLACRRSFERLTEILKQGRAS